MSSVSPSYVSAIGSPSFTVLVLNDCLVLCVKASSI